MKESASPTNGGEQVFIAVTRRKRTHNVHHDVGEPLVWNLEISCVD